MNYRILGATGVKVSALAYGGSSLGSEFGPIDEAEGIRSVHVALDHGINLIDTPPYYGRTTAETVLGKALKGVARDRYVLATKVGRYGKTPSECDFSAARVKKSVDESLARLMNDANAGALAEWRFDAGQGARNLAFLTCGTGFGAGLVLDRRIYSGANGNAGEIGHLRLTPDGPVGYGKAGSAEGWCSGGGLTQYAQAHAAALRKALSLPDDTAIVARHVGEAAALGCPEALELLTAFGQRLGQALALLIDLLNLDTIVIGSIFVRCERWLRPPMEAVIAKEALPQSAAVCRIVPAALGEEIGNYAAIAAASE